jgi:hypothetical protein
MSSGPVAFSITRQLLPVYCEYHPVVIALVLNLMPGSRTLSAIWATHSLDDVDEPDSVYFVTSIESTDILHKLTDHDIAFLCRQGLHNSHFSPSELISSFESVISHISRLKGLHPEFVYRVLLLARNMGRGELFLHQLRRDEILGV